ncbi:hypothetical protein BJ508DRAFT_312716 [Ascobolus immersus RN42]|uniref:Uncharacterized protein n=1 Tax=Ascobolus immersus RN42 TaxID=1160509 RepID=A0A3N4HY60_ASCIM|nr:hypothetical protein BJ508DRAFT_312716 [Ascobolus immersus RN42]
MADPSSSPTFNNGNRMSRQQLRDRVRNPPPLPPALVTARKAYGGGRGSAVYRDRKEKRAKHWCEAYDANIFADGFKGRMLFSKEHSDLLSKGCQEYNFHGSAGHPLGSPKVMATRILREVGGCNGQGPNCSKMVLRVRSKLINIGRKRRAEKRLAGVVDPDSIEGDEYIPGVEILRSRNWVRDRGLAKILDEYDVGEDDIAAAIFSKRFPKVLISSSINHVDVAKLLDEQHDDYPGTITDDEVVADPGLEDMDEDYWWMLGAGWCGV